MAKQAGLFIIAVGLTIFEVTVVVCNGWRLWAAHSVDFWSLGSSLLVAALGATSLANLWVHVFSARGVLFCIPRASRPYSAELVPAQARGQVNV